MAARPASAQVESEEESALSPPVAELVTDRPDVTESTSIVPTRWAQVETGATYERNDEREPGFKLDAGTLSVPGTLLRVGLSPRVEARIGWAGYLFEETEDSGAGDGEVGVKLLLFERRGLRPDMALLPAVAVPLGGEESSDGSFDPELKLLFANDFTERVGWGANLGVGLPNGDEGRELAASWSYSLGLGFTDRLGGFLEYFGEAPAAEPDAHSVDGGLTFKVTPQVQLDASGGVGLVEAAPDWFVGAGLAFRFQP